MTEAAVTKSAVVQEKSVSPRLEQAIIELRSLHELLLSGEGLDPSILTDFRNAVNRVRNTAWSAQQFLALKATAEDPGNVLSIAAGERVRAAYHLCQAIQMDLQSSEIKFQPGHLIELHQAVKVLNERLASAVSALSS